jgi:hypothetical protein
MKTIGRFALSFNRHGAAPLVWAITRLDPDEPNPDRARMWELAVPAFGLEGVRVSSIYRPRPLPDDETGLASAWLLVEGELEILADGSAVIRAVG